MRRSSAALLLAIPVLLAMARGRQESGTEGARGGETTAGEMRAAIEETREDPDPSYHLRVDCGGSRGVRSLELFPGGVAIWNHRVQFEAPDSLRSKLLDLLLQGGFPDLAPRYGGRPEPEGPQAALRVICRVELEIDGRRKSSIQFAEGEQSPELAELAAALLDAAEERGRAGTIATDLEDGLEKLARGELAPAGFELRFVQLPPTGDQGTGTILRLVGSTAVRRAYAPGREVGETVSRDLERDRFADVVAALREAKAWELPVNLWSDDHVELEVRVLDRRRTIVARPFTRLAGRRADKEQERFDELVATLKGLESALAP